MDENPYKSPESESMKAMPLPEKARRLLAMRQSGISVGYCLRQSAAQHTVVSAICLVIALAIYAIGHQWGAFLIGGMWIGQFLRDIKWYRKQSVEWETTRQLIDWGKVETIASA